MADEKLFAAFYTLATALRPETVAAILEDTKGVPGLTFSDARAAFLQRRRGNVEAQQLLDRVQYRRSVAVPVTFAGPAIASVPDRAETFRTAFIQVNASGRPDLRDLGRVIRTENDLRAGGHGDVMFSLSHPPELFFWVVIENPVPCEFSMLVPVAGNDTFFELVLEQGAYSVLIDAAPLEAEAVVPLSDSVLHLTVDQGILRQQLGWARSVQ